MNIKLKDLFEKEINRDIKGVIKVGQCDQENIKQELEEYVFTDELHSHFNEFFKAYSRGILDSTDRIGVWISGFFGSGKSHFLKILSYVLSNETIGNKSALDYFYSKELQDSTLRNMELIKNLSTDTLLFNIDSKSDSTSESHRDAIVNVLNRVFNEMQGFCGSMPWIADMERQMTEDGVYEDFKEVFHHISGKPWTQGREDFYYEEDALIEALSKATKMSEDAAKNWYSKCEENYSLTIDKFSSRVREYCDLKGNNHHVVFLIDEIGQYLGEDIQLMLNLQTVVEDLGSKCEGRCWIIVTSQEDLDEFTNAKGNDFSKIQGRFNTRLSLSSASVDEVIQKRILRKTPEASEELQDLYREKESIIRNLLTFTTDTVDMKLYKDNDDFAQVYPFVPYQFNLLQSVFNGIRSHGVAGRSLSKGERSLLGAYQQVAVEYMNNNTGTLVPFSAFYSPIEIFLDSSIRTVISYAEKNEGLNIFDIKVLKLLFLIKYVNGINANIENLSTLLVDNIESSKKEIKEQLQESLSKLIRETLVEKNGDEYVFLTVHEQEVNKEIKNMTIDSGEITQRIGEIIFDHIYEGSKFTYSKKYALSFNKIIDQRGRGPQINDIGIKVITANYDLVEGVSKNHLKELSDRENNVIVDISDHDNYLEEIENILKIDVYLRIKANVNSTIDIEDIKIKKIKEREIRLKRAKFLIEEALKESDIYVSGTLLDIKVKGVVGRINEGSRALIDSRYNKINYIKEFIDSSRDLYNIVEADTSQRIIEDNEVNKLALEEVNNYILTSSMRNIQLTVKSILTKFSNSPYGWKELDIKGVILKLFKKQYIRVIYDNEVVPSSCKDIVDYLVKREYEEKVILKNREKVASKYIDVAKELIKELFGGAYISSDEEVIMNCFKELGKEELNNIEDMILSYTFNKSYPGEEVVALGERLFESLLNIEDTIEFFKYLYDLEEDFLDYVDYIDNIKGFFYKKENNMIDLNSRGEQRIIFDSATDVLNSYEENKEFIDNAEIEGIVEDLQNILWMKEPYSRIPQLPLLIENYNNKMLELVNKEEIPVLEFINLCKNEVIENLKCCDFYNEFVNKINKDFENLTNKTLKSRSFAVISSMYNLSEKLKLKLISEIIKESGIENSAKILSMRELVKGEKTIKNDDDIDLLLKNLRKKLKDELKEDTIINLI
ncbi:BREX system P-loop protein BrxC [Clostridium sp.]|uniref:BREX system P-loop protein BrxC n=1 Tax=Clostridium sp. TaxID=1506 RepID=UPI0034639526